jgi:hypothetical protein
MHKKLPLIFVQIRFAHDGDIIKWTWVANVQVNE